jgi:hypothetical protein
MICDCDITETTSIIEKREGKKQNKRIKGTEQGNERKENR